MAELAFAIPILLLLGLACADFGRVSHFQLIVSNAARAAAEVGATTQFTPLTRSRWEAGVRQAAVEELQNIRDFDVEQLGFSLSTSTDADGIVLLAVTLEYPFSTAVVWPGLPSALTLRERIELRQFR